MNEEQIKEMTNRFLGYKLPEDFNPDGGIYFDAYAAVKQNAFNRKYEPVGTNLFTYTQAEGMVRYMLQTPSSRSMEQGYRKDNEHQFMPTQRDVPEEESAKTNVKPLNPTPQPAWEEEWREMPYGKILKEKGWSEAPESFINRLLKENTAATLREVMEAGLCDRCRALLEI